MTLRGLVISPPFELVVYPAFEQSFFIDPTVLLLFRAAAHSRRLHSALDRRTRPVRSASRDIGKPSWDLRNVITRLGSGRPDHGRRPAVDLMTTFLNDGGG